MRRTARLIYASETNAPSLVGYARVVADGERCVAFALLPTIKFQQNIMHIRFAYLADVFILPAHRGLGLGKQVVLSAFQNSGDPELDDPESRDSTKWRWFLFATKAKDMYYHSHFYCNSYDSRSITRYIRMGFRETDRGYVLDPGTLVVSPPEVR